MSTSAPSDPYRLIVISGPIASGKSTLAGAVAGRLREEQRSVAVVGLDTIAEMALPTLPEWEWAHQVHARTVAFWLTTPIDVVLVEGTETAEEVNAVLDQVPDGVRALRVTLHVPYEVALQRAQGDSARGVSKEPDFLRRMHDRFDAGRQDLRSDLVLATESQSVEALTSQVVDAFRAGPADLVATEDSA